MASKRMADYKMFAHFPVVCVCVRACVCVSIRVTDSRVSSSSLSCSISNTWIASVLNFSFRRYHDCVGVNIPFLMLTIFLYVDEHLTSAGKFPGKAAFLHVAVLCLFLSRCVFSLKDTENNEFHSGAL